MIKKLLLLLTLSYTPIVLALYEVGPGGYKTDSKAIAFFKACKYNHALADRKNPFKKGDSVLVEWQNLWFKAVVIDVKTRATSPFKIHYIGWDKKWDEHVSINRILHYQPCLKK